MPTPAIPPALRSAPALMLALGLLLTAPARANPPPGDPAASAVPAARIPSEPIARPAQRVPQAAQAGLLASTRAGARIVAVGERGVVMLSDDDGRSFRQAREVPVDVTLTAVSFADARRGWAAGHWGTVLATTDGGETWVRQHQDVRSDQPLFALHFFDAQQGVAVGLWSLVLTTADGGQTWSEQKLPPMAKAKKADLNLLSLFADGRGTVYATAEQGQLLRSADQGQTWQYLDTGYRGSLWAGAVLADGSLLVGGQRGTLMRSADAGSTWERVPLQSKSSVTAIAVREAQVTVVGLDGLQLHSSDGGKSFLADTRPDGLSLTSVLGRPGGGQPLLFSRRGVVAAVAGATGG